MGVLVLHENSDALEQTEVCVLLVGLELRHGTQEGPAHGAGEGSGLVGVGTGLVVLAAGEHDHVGGRHLGLPDLLELFLALVVRRPVEERLGAGQHHADVPGGVAHEDLGAVARAVLPDVVLLQASILGPIREGEVQGGTAVAGVEDGRQTTPGRQRSHHDVMHYVVDDGTALLEVDRVDALIHTVDLVAVEVLLLSAVA